MIKKKLTNGKVIIKDQYGVYSCITEGIKKVALVGCKDLKMNSEDERNYKIVQGENRPWCDDWNEDYKTNLTRAEAKSIIRHFAKEIRNYEEEHQMMYPWYYFAYRKVYESHYWNEPQISWEPIEL